MIVRAFDKIKLFENENKSVDKRTKSFFYQLFLSKIYFAQYKKKIGNLKKSNLMLDFEGRKKIGFIGIFFYKVSVRIQRRYNKEKKKTNNNQNIRYKGNTQSSQSSQNSKSNLSNRNTLNLDRVDEEISDPIIFGFIKANLYLSFFKKVKETIQNKIQIRENQSFCYKYSQAKFFGQFLFRISSSFKKNYNKKQLKQIARKFYLKPVITSLKDVKITAEIKSQINDFYYLKLKKKILQAFKLNIIRVSKMEMIKEKFDFYLLAKAFKQMKRKLNGKKSQI